MHPDAAASLIDKPAFDSTGTCRWTPAQLQLFVLKLLQLRRTAHDNCQLLPFGSCLRLYC